MLECFYFPASLSQVEDDSSDSCSLFLSLLSLFRCFRCPNAFHHPKVTPLCFSSSAPITLFSSVLRLNIFGIPSFSSSLSPTGFSLLRSKFVVYRAPNLAFRRVLNLSPLRSPSRSISSASRPGIYFWMRISFCALRTRRRTGNAPVESHSLGFSIVCHGLFVVCGILGFQTHLISIPCIIYVFNMYILSFFMF